MQSLIAKGPRLSSFCLLDLAIRESFADFLFDCLLEALKKSEEELSIDPSPTIFPSHDQALEYRFNFIKRLTVVIENEEDGALINNYLNLVATAEADLVKDITPNLLACEIEPLLSFLDTNTRELPQFDNLQSLHIYRALPLPYKSFTTQSLLLAPFYYLVHLPFWPPNESNKIRPLIFNHLRNESNSISNLAMRLLKSGLRVRVPFLRFILLNDESVIFIDQIKEVFTQIDNFIPKFDLYAKLIERKLYSSWEANYFNPIFDDENPRGITEINNLKFNLNRLKALIFNRVNPNLIENIDWLEVGAKLFISNDESKEKIQGLPAELHKSLIEQLVLSKKALKKNDFINSIGFKFNLEPDALPYGRIMAYVTHQRFLNEDDAYYVLSDWVETDTQKKGRISRNRIATPFSVKDITFNKMDLFRIIHADDFYLEFGIVDLDEITKKLIQFLPSNPFEPYYIRVIKENINIILKDQMVYLGLVFYMRKDLCLPRKTLEPMNLWRLRIISSSIKTDMNIKNVIASIENLRIKDSLSKMIRSN